MSADTRCYHLVRKFTDDISSLLTGIFLRKIVMKLRIKYGGPESVTQPKKRISDGRFINYLMSYGSRRCMHVSEHHGLADSLPFARAESV